MVSVASDGVTDTQISDRLTVILFIFTSFLSILLKYKSDDGFNKM